MNLDHLILVAQFHLVRLVIVLTRLPRKRVCLQSKRYSTVRDYNNRRNVMTVVLKRAYQPPSAHDGVRVLVDHIWPRGLTKSEVAVDVWLRDLAPSNELRRWHHAHTGHWASFRKKYLKELSLPEAEAALQKLYILSGKRKRVTLVFASKNEEKNNATVLKELLDGTRKPPTGTGPGAARATRRREAAVGRK
jgi:uncharacterized protein YeaO (DUF488 family)